MRSTKLFIFAQFMQVASTLVEMLHSSNVGMDWIEQGLTSHSTYFR